MHRLVAALAATAFLAACGSGGAAAGSAPQRTRAVFTDASARVTNPWYPLRAGTTYVYRGVADGKPVRDVFKVTRGTHVVNGVRCAVIDDRVYQEGRLVERTTDWYAQDRSGNVWYLGERTATLNADGSVKSTEGTWQDGVDGARAGIFMPARPRVGQAFQQEYYRGHAEDRFKILSLSTHVRTPAVSSRHALLSEETSRLEPGVVDHKVYVRGIGTVREASVKGGNERLDLVSVRRG